jgi:hypothetical protein
MKLNTETLPSEGYGCPYKELDVEPMNYSELIAYKKLYVGSEKDKLLADIDTIVNGIKGAMALNIYDLKAIIFTRKFITGTYNPIFKVEHGNLIYIVDASKIEFKKLDENITNISKIKLGDEFYNFNLPTISYFRNVLFDINTTHSNLDMKLVYILSMLGYLENKDQVFKAVTTAKQQDILLLENIYKKIAHPIKSYGLMSSLDSQEGGGPVIDDLNETITDLFRFIEINNVVSPERITVK